jgi:hypothetical protein
MINSGPSKRITMHENFHGITLENLFGSNYDPTKLLEVTFEHQ